MAKNAGVGAHLFYCLAGTWGQPSIFSKTYSGHEPSAATLRAAALAVPHIVPIYGENQLAKLIKDIPGTEPLKLSPSLRGDKRVAVRFTQIARKAAEEAPHVEYSKNFEVSENLKWSLSSETVASDQRPLGKPAQAANAAGASSNR